MIFARLVKAQVNLAQPSPFAKSTAHFDFVKATLSVKIHQIAALIKVSILNATHSDPECSVFGVHVGAAGAVEVEAA